MNGPGVTRRRLLASAGGAALGALAGCQGFGSSDPETLTAAPVPEGTLPTGQLTVRHRPAETGPSRQALRELAAEFDRATEGIDPVVVPAERASGRSTPNGGVLTYRGVGARLRGVVDDHHSLDSLWQDVRPVVPDGLAAACYLGRSRVAVPQTVHRLNCLYYNPTVLEDAGVSPEDYTTVQTLAAEPGPLADAVETLFAQPLRSPTELLALWESLLASRLYRERQYVQYVVGDISDNPLPIRRSLRDLDAALSMLPASAQDAAPEALLDDVVDGTVGFVRQPTWTGTHLIDRSDATYGTDWAVAPVFASPWTVTFAAWGFSVPNAPTRAAAPQDVIEFATTPARQQQFCATARAIPARTDVVVDAHPMVAEQAEDYREASMHLPSMAHGIAVRPPVRRRLETALSSFRQHRNVDRGVEDLVAALRTARVL